MSFNCWMFLISRTGNTQLPYIFHPFKHVQIIDMLIVPKFLFVAFINVELWNHEGGSPVSESF